MDREGTFLYFNPACIKILGDGIQSWIGLSTRRPQDKIADHPVAQKLTPPGFLDEHVFHSVAVSLEGQPHELRVQYQSFGAADSAFVIATLGAPQCQPATQDTKDLFWLAETVNRHRSALTRDELGIALQGDHPLSIRMRRQIKVASGLFEHVYISGPKGCPFEAVVRSINSDSVLHAIPLIPIDAGLMDFELLELSARPAIDILTESRDRRATLIFRNIDELPIDAADLLQRWLEQFEGRLRCICTSQFSVRELLTKSSASSKLLPKLALQLATIEILIPSLSDRREELPTIIASLLTKRMAKGSRVEGIARSALDQLTLYPWPGDYAELEEAVRHAAMSCPRGTIQVEHLPLQIRSWRLGSKPSNRVEPIELDHVLSGLEAEIIRRALTRCQGNRTHSAKLLGISRARLIRRITELQIEASLDASEQDNVDE